MIGSFLVQFFVCFSLLSLVYFETLRHEATKKPGKGKLKQKEDAGGVSTNESPRGERKRGQCVQANRPFYLYSSSRKKK